MDMNLKNTDVVTEKQRDGYETYKIGKVSIVRIESFLPEAAVNQLLLFAQSEEQNFMESKTTANRENIRKSVVLYKLGLWAKIFTQKISSFHLQAAEEIGVGAFQRGNVEVQLTATGDGGYFKQHNDCDGIGPRKITFVYYFNSRPVCFSGGNIRFFERISNSGIPDPVTRLLEIQPVSNSLILFPSNLQHEITLVSCKSHRFVDSRFTINGWMWERALSD